MGEVTAALVLAGASAAISAVGAISQGNAQSSAMKAQAAEMERQREAEKTRAMQEETARREELASTLSTIRAVRAGRGNDQRSPTALTINEAITDDGMGDLFTARNSSILRQDSLRMGAQAYRSQASQARLAGYLNATSSLLSFGSTAAGSMGGGGSSSSANPNAAGRNYGTVGGKRLTPPR